MKHIRFSFIHKKDIDKTHLSLALPPHENTARKPTNHLRTTQINLLSVTKRRKNFLKRPFNFLKRRLLKGVSIMLLSKRLFVRVYRLFQSKLWHIVRLFFMLKRADFDFLCAKEANPK